MKTKILMMVGLLFVSCSLQAYTLTVVNLSGATFAEGQMVFPVGVIQIPVSTGFNDTWNSSGAAADFGDLILDADSTIYFYDGGDFTYEHNQTVNYWTATKAGMGTGFLACGFGLIMAMARRTTSTDY